MLEASMNSRSIGIVFLLAVVVFLSDLATVRAAERGFLGMQVQGNSPKIAAALGLATASGVLVRDISVDGPAGNAGLRRGDIIVKMHGTGIDTFERLLQVAGGLKVGDTAELEVLRLGETVKLTMIVSEWPDGWQIEKSAFAAQPDLGITLASLTPKLRANMGLRWGTVGIAVSVFNDMFIGVTPLRRGDVIRQINQKPVWLPQQFLDAYAQAKSDGRPSLLLLVERSDGFKYLLQPVAQKIDMNQMPPPLIKLPGQQGG